MSIGQGNLQINSLDNGVILSRALHILANSILTDEPNIHKYHGLLDYACICHAWMDTLKGPMSETVIIQGKVDSASLTASYPDPKYSWASNIQFIVSSGTCSRAKTLRIIGVEQSSLFYFHKTLETHGFDGGMWNSIKGIAFIGSFFYSWYDRDYSTYEVEVCDYLMEMMPNLETVDVATVMRIRFVYVLYNELSRRIASKPKETLIKC